MKYTIVERWYKSYEVEADSFEEAHEKGLNDPQEALDHSFECICYITDETGKEVNYS